MARASLLSVLTLIGLAAIGAEFASATGIKKQASKSVTGIKKPTSHSAANEHLAQQLQAIRTILNKADHDYKGHRAAAVHEITHAIHLAQHGQHHSNPGLHFKGGSHNEQQAISDAQLKQSLIALQTLNIPASNHQVQIQASLQKAIANLQIALKIA